MSSDVQTSICRRRLNGYWKNAVANFSFQRLRLCLRNNFTPIIRRRQSQLYRKQANSNAGNIVWSATSRPSNYTVKDTLKRPSVSRCRSRGRRSGGGCGPVIFHNANSPFESRPKYTILLTTFNDDGPTVVTTLPNSFMRSVVKATEVSAVWWRSSCRLGGKRSALSRSDRPQRFAPKQVAILASKSPDRLTCLAVSRPITFTAI